MSSHLVVGSLVTLHTHSAHREERSVGLGDLVVQASLSDLRDEDLVGFLNNLNLASGDFTQNADGQTRSREGMASHQMLRDLQQSAKCSHFV